MRFTTNIHLACGTDDLRPIMSHICFRNGYAYATDAHVLVKQCLKRIHGATDEDVAALEGFLISSETYKAIKDRELFIVSGIGAHKERTCSITAIAEKKKPTITITLTLEEFIGKWPNADAVIPKFEECCKSNECHMNSKVLTRLLSCLAFDTSTFSFHFKMQANNRAILVCVDSVEIPDDAQVALLMPVMYNN